MVSAFVPFLVPDLRGQITYQPVRLAQLGFPAGTACSSVVETRLRWGKIQHEKQASVRGDGVCCADPFLQLSINHHQRLDTGPSTL